MWAWVGGGGLDGCGLAIGAWWKVIMLQSNGVNTDEILWNPLQLHQFAKPSSTILDVHNEDAVPERKNLRSSSTLSPTNGYDDGEITKLTRYTGWDTGWDRHLSLL